jgi:hypothetical protein
MGEHISARTLSCLPGPDASLNERVDAEIDGRANIILCFPLDVHGHRPIWRVRSEQLCKSIIVRGKRAALRRIYKGEEQREREAASPPPQLLLLISCNPIKSTSSLYTQIHETSALMRNKVSVSLFFLPGGRR